MLRSLRANTVARSQSITNRSGYVATLSLYLQRATSSRGSRASSRSMPALSPPLLNSATQYLCCFTYLSSDHRLRLKHVRRIAGFALDQCRNLPVSHKSLNSSLKQYQKTTTCAWRCSIAKASTHSNFLAVEVTTPMSACHRVHGREWQRPWSTPAKAAKQERLDLAVPRGPISDSSRTSATMVPRVLWLKTHPPPMPPDKRHRRRDLQSQRQH